MILDPDDLITFNEIPLLDNTWIKTVIFNDLIRSINRDINDPNLPSSGIAAVCNLRNFLTELNGLFYKYQNFLHFTSAAGIMRRDRWYNMFIELNKPYITYATHIGEDILNFDEVVEFVENWDFVPEIQLTNQVPNAVGIFMQLTKFK